ncbi:MAG: helix-turn-helix transcriptional regulator [Bacteroidetes bacterium]|nr:helix-turn-helix transcriptional regulator [Bacteroidota bacterium]
MVKAKLFIDENYKDNIDLNNIAEEAYFSKFHFIRLFKTIYGKTPHQYLTAIRIDKARLLLGSHHTIAQTCYDVGFDSITSFTGLFKKIEGKTPSEYQRQIRERQERIRNTPLQFIPNCFAEQKGWTKNRNFEEVL